MGAIVVLIGFAVFTGGFSSFRNQNERFVLVFHENMYGLYDTDGILRFVNSDKEACLDYAKLFELNSAHYLLMNVIENIDKENNINLDLNQVENNN